MTTTTPAPSTCTFCWRPCRDGGPRALGRSARLACRACHAAILRLAVCWVCGEVVCRGDECVSLGWCFWHRACYGCLLCRSRRVARGSTVAELFEDEEGGGGGGGRAVEVAEVPLCAGCAAACDAEGARGDGLVEKCLGLTDLADGGLARQRWEAGMGAARARQGAGGGGVGRGRQPAPPRPGLPLPAEGTALVPCPQVDGAGSAMPPAREPSPDPTFHVSISDPVGRPAFRPSPTKPLPAWMRLLPSRVRPAAGGPAVPPSALDARFPRAPWAREDAAAVRPGPAAVPGSEPAGRRGRGQDAEPVPGPSCSPGGPRLLETPRVGLPRRAPSISNEPPARRPSSSSSAEDDGAAEPLAPAEPAHAGSPPGKQGKRTWANQAGRETGKHNPCREQRDGHSSGGTDERGGNRRVRWSSPGESRTATKAGTRDKSLRNPNPGRGVHDARATRAYASGHRARRGLGSEGAAVVPVAVYRCNHAEGGTGRKGGESEAAAGAARATATVSWQKTK